MARGTIPTPPPVARPPVPPPLPESPERRLIDEQLDRTRAQVRTVDVLFGVLAVAVGAILLLLCAAVIDHWLVGLRVWGRLAVLAVVLGWSAWCAWRWVAPSLVRRVNPLYAAYAIERNEPSLKNSLINYLLVRSHPEETGAVVQNALERQAATDIARAPVESAVDRTHVLRLAYALIAVVLAFALYKVASPKDPFQTVARVLAPLADIDRPSRVTIRDVAPGEDREIFHGRDLTVSAVIDGLNADETPELHYSTADGQIVDAAVSMNRDENGLRWQGVLPPDSLGAQQDFRYRIRAGDAVSREYQVRVSPAPSIVVRSVEYVYPAYTRRESQTVEDRGDISGLVGTRVTLRAEANQPIQRAWIEFDPPVGGGLTGDDSDRTGPLKRLPMRAEDRTASASFRLEWDAQAGAPRHRTYRIRFVTEEGHRNERPIVHAIDVQRDLPPEVEILEPRENRIEIPEDGQREIVVRAIDPDFGVRQISLRAVVGGSDLQIPTLLDDAEGRTGQIVVEHVFAPRDYKLTAGDHVVYWARVEDNRTAPGQNTPEPNSARTRNYHIVITPPTKSESESSSGEKEEGPRTKDEGQEKSADQGEGAGESEGEKQGGEGEGESAGAGQEGGMGEGQSEGGQAGEGESGQSQHGEGQGAASGSSAKGQNGGEQTGGGAEQSGSNEGDGMGERKESHAGQGEQLSGENQTGSESGERAQPSQSGGERGKPTPGKQPSGQDGQSGQGEQTGQGGPAGQGQPDGAAGEQPLSPDGVHDREVFERIQDYLREKQQNGASSEGTNSSGSENSGADGQENASPQPGETPQNAGRRDEGGAAKQPDQRQGEAEGQRAGKGEGGRPQGPAETQPEKADPQRQPGAKQSTPGRGDNGESGAGAKTDKPRGSPESQETNRDRQKNLKPGEQKETDNGASSPSTSKKQSDSQGGEGGDRSGGGEQGGGQGAKQAGNDSAGSSSAADQGAGAADEQGAGETSDMPGSQKLSDEPTGNPSESPGAGGSTRQSPSGRGAQKERPKDEGRRTKPEDAQSETTPPQDGSSSANGSQRGGREGAGRHTFGPQPQGGSPSENPPQDQTPPPAVPENADVNLEYARKATDLALETLRDQETQPDEEMLDRLGWTPEDLQRFLARWEAMKTAAAQDGPAGEEARRTLDETLESLGLRPGGGRIRRGGVERDQRRGLRDSGHRTEPPPEYRKQFEAYLKGAGRVSP